MTKLSLLREKVRVLPGLELMNRGKIRDTYKLNHRTLLVVASDGISIFDFVLNAMIPMKGSVLTAMSHFWFKLLEKYGVRTHFIAAGADIDSHLPPDLRGDQDLQSRAMVVKSLRMLDVEFIARGYITGTGLKAYIKDGAICGHRLPGGLRDGDALTYVLDTPSTKAQEGHDEHINAHVIREQYPEETFLLLKIYQIIASFAREKGIIFADTKFEFGHAEDGPILGDEVGTPDSSRFWSLDVWQKSRESKKQKSPPPLDKQIVRDWGLGLGINKRDPKNPEEVAWVQKQRVPEPLVLETKRIYGYIFQQITGLTLEEYLNDCFGVKIS